MTNMIGTILRAALVIAVASAISCAIATAVTGEAAGVANANCAMMKSRTIIPVGARPMEEAKLNMNGMTKTIMIILLAKLVIMAAKAKATMMKTSGGRTVNGVSSLLMATAIPVSGVFIYVATTMI